MIFKEAQQVNFTNETALQQSLSRISDREFNEYITVLSQIHADMMSQPGAPLQEVVEGHVDNSFYQRKMIELINSIGLPVFTGNQFDTISQALQVLKSGPEEVPAAEMGEQDPAALTLEDRIREAKTRDYPVSNRAEQEEINRRLQNIDVFFAQLNDPATPHYQKNEIYEAIVETLDDLESIARGEAPEMPEEEPEPEEVEEPEEELEETFFDSSKVGGGVSLGDDGADLVKDTESRREKTTVKKEPEEAGAHPIFGNLVEEGTEGVNTDLIISQFFDLKSDPPSFKSDVYDRVYQNFLQFVDYLSRNVDERINRENFKAPVNMASEFNDLLFSIKSLEKKVKEELLSFKEQGVLDEKQYNQFFNQVNTNLVTSRIAGDEELFRNKLLLPILYMSSGFLTKTLYSGENATYKVIGLEQADPELVRDTAKDTLHKLLYPKFRKSLDTTNAKYFSSMNNFLGEMHINSGILAYNVRRQLTGKPSYESKAYCPTCSKEITWAYSAEIAKSAATTAGGVTKAEKARGFELPMYSLFARGAEGLTALTMRDVLYQEAEGQMIERKFDPPGPEDYNDEIEIRRISEYKGSKTWKEIESMIYSNNRALHEEGMHRRSAALKSLGAVPAGQFGKKTKTANARAIRVRNVMSECPFSGEADDFCGLSMSPVEGAENTFNFQPTESITGEKWSGRAIEDKSLRNSALKKTAGGFKFSKVSFACPAHWEDLDSNGVEQKHFRLAISSMGPAGGDAGYVPPIDGRTGLPKEMPDGTMSYLVCGALTSLSSFDRDPGSYGYIVNIMSKVREQNPEGYVKVMDYLARQGVDLGDLLHISSTIEETPYKISESFLSEDRKQRINKIAELLSEAATRTDIPEYEILKNIMLVCPHGHRFTIGKSMEFNQAHAGVTVRKNFAVFKSIMETRGFANVEALIRSGVLIKVESELQLKDRSAFDSWDGRSIRTLYIPITNKEGDTENYIFNPSKKVARNAFHVSNTDYTQSHEPFIVSEIIDEEIASELQMADLGRRQDGDNTGITGIENMNAETLEQKLGESERPPTIPGLYAEEDADTNVHDRVEPLARALSASLKVIMTWTKGVANSDLARTLTYADPGKVEGYANQLAEGLVAGKLIRYVIPDVVEEGGRRRRVYREEAFPVELKDEFTATLSEQLMKNSNYYGFFEGALTQENAPDIIIDTTISAVYTFMDKEDMEGEVDFGEGVSDDSITAFVKDFMTKSKDFVAVFARQGNLNKKTFVKKDYRSRIYLHSYALYLAEVLVGVYTGFLAQDAIEPIGYDIGIDLSTVEKILDVTEDDLGKITTSIPKNYFFGIREDESDTVLGRIARNIDRAYDRIRYAMANGRGFAATPAALTKSRSMIIRRLQKFVPEDEREDVEKIFDAAFPTKFLNFDDSLNPGGFTPIPSKDPKNFLIPGGLEGTVSEGDVVINESLNYRSDRFQVGMIGPKPGKQDMGWPLNLKDGFVGVHIPFTLPTRTKGLTISRLKQTPIADFNIIVDMGVSSEDTSPLDITPFFMRGRDEAQEKVIQEIRAAMKQEVDRFKGAIETAATPEKRAKLVRSLNAKLREYHETIKSMPPKVRTKTSLLNTSAVDFSTGEGQAVPSPYTAMTLESPDIVAEMVKHPYLIFPDYDYKPDEARVKKFFANIYKLDVVANVISNVSGEDVGVDDLLSTSFYSKLDSMENKVRRKIDASLAREWTDSIGMYYDVIPNGVEAAEEGEDAKPTEKNTGSFISYVFSDIPDIAMKRGRPVVKPQEQEGQLGITEMDNLVKKIIRDGMADTESANSLLGRIPEFLTSYLDDSTAGEFEKTSEDADSEIIIKSAERRRELERIILSMGFEGLYID
jgi:hypothetical protein